MHPGKVNKPTFLDYVARQQFSSWQLHISGGTVHMWVWNLLPFSLQQIPIPNWFFFNLNVAVCFVHSNQLFQCDSGKKRVLAKSSFFSKQILNCSPYKSLSSWSRPSFGSKLPSQCKRKRRSVGSTNFYGNLNPEGWLVSITKKSIEHSSQKCETYRHSWKVSKLSTQKKVWGFTIHGFTLFWF